MPNYLVLHVKRFTKNSFFIEKNPTIVNFPVKCVGRYIFIDITSYILICRCVHRNLDFGDYVADSHRVPGKSYRYNLVCNIVHDGQPGAGKGTYRVHVYHKGTRQWYEIQDLHVANMLPEMITLSESYIQVKKYKDLIAIGRLVVNLPFS